MSKNSRLYHPSLEGSSSVGESTHLRPSLYDDKDEFITSIAPFAVAAFYFGSFSLAPQDSSLARQALFKLSFLNRHFLQPAGLRVVVEKQTAILSGSITSHLIYSMADILAHQIEGIRQVKDTTTPAVQDHANETAQDSIQFLFATDQTLRTGVQVGLHEGRLTLTGEVLSLNQKKWAEQLAAAAIGAEVDSTLKVSNFTPPPQLPAAEPPQLDDESLQALVLFRLRLVRDTEHLPLRVKASRGTVTIQGKVRSEGLRQRAENIARSTLGIRELRSTISIIA